MVVAVNPPRKEELGLSEEETKNLPIIEHEYQRWYSEALACISQLLPARVQDFVAYYKPERPRKDHYPCQTTPFRIT